LVQHATHNGSPDVNTYQLETVLKYACFPGYLTIGFAHAKCFLYNDTAQWFGPDITCKGEKKKPKNQSNIYFGKKPTFLHFNFKQIPEPFFCQTKLKLVMLSF